MAEPIASNIAESSTTAPLSDDKAVPLTTSQPPLTANEQPGSTSGAPSTTTHDVTVGGAAVTTTGSATVPPAEPVASVATAFTWPALADDHPLSQFHNVLPTILEATDHNEVYGITLHPKSTSAAPDFHTLLILQKFLRANQNDLTRAKDQLTKTLAWRKEFNPIKASQEIFAKDKFAGVGYITVVPAKDHQPVPIVTTWNIYGAVKDYEKTFAPVETFLRWRIGLMELGVAKLGLASANAPIPDYGQGPDPYQGIQVHDYKHVSFLRVDPRAKAASKATIQLLGDYYPETLSRKFFVNVPIFMQWMFTFSKAIISAETAKKFVVLNDGKQVVTELGENVPGEYGGKLGELSTIGEGVKVE